MADFPTKEPVDYNSMSSRGGQTRIKSEDVRDKNIKNFTFDKARGGILTLGGLNNQGGILQVVNSQNVLISQQDSLGTHYYDSNGVESVLIDSTGITIRGINGTKILDNRGIVSSTQFTLNKLVGVPSMIFTNTSPALMPGSSLGTINLDRPTNILCIFNVFGCMTKNINLVPDVVRVKYFDTLSGQIIYGSYFTGTVCYDAAAIPPAFNGVIPVTTCGSIIVGAAAGSYNFALSYQVTGQTGYIYSWEIAYCLLGT